MSLEFIVAAIVAVLAVLSIPMWVLLYRYISPQKVPSERNAFAQLVATGTFGLAALGSFLVAWSTFHQTQLTQLKEAQDAALAGYIDEMSNLLINEELLTSESDDPARIQAQARTLSILPRLDPAGKGDVVSFLYQTQLIKGEQAVIDLGEADLREADLQDANLQHVNLHNADLRQADLRQADMNETILQYANLQITQLQNANLRDADLQYANLQDARVTDKQLDTAENPDSAIGSPGK